MMHLVFTWIQVKVCKSRDWYSRDLVSEHFDHVQLQAQDVGKPIENRMRI